MAYDPVQVTAFLDKFDQVSGALADTLGRLTLLLNLTNLRPQSTSPDPLYSQGFMENFGSTPMGIRQVVQIQWSNPQRGDQLTRDLERIIIGLDGQTSWDQMLQLLYDAVELRNEIAAP